MTFISSLARNIFCAFSSAIGVQLLSDQALAIPDVDFSSILKNPWAVTKIVDCTDSLPCIQTISRHILHICPNISADPGSCVPAPTKWSVLVLNTSQMANDQYNAACTQILTRVSEVSSPALVYRLFGFQVERMPRRCISDDIITHLVKSLYVDYPTNSSFSTLTNPEIIEELSLVTNPQPLCSDFAPVSTVAMGPHDFVTATHYYQTTATPSYYQPAETPPSSTALVATQLTAAGLESVIDYAYGSLMAEGMTKKVLVAATKTATVFGIYYIAGQSALPYVATRIGWYGLTSVAKKCWNCFRNRAYIQ